MLMLHAIYVRTLVNSMRTWNSSGLLDMVSERVALLNDPFPSEQAIALQHGFEVLQPKNIAGAKVRFLLVRCCNQQWHTVFYVS